MNKKLLYKKKRKKRKLEKQVKKLQKKLDKRKKETKYIMQKTSELQLKSRHMREAISLYLNCMPSLEKEQIKDIV